MKFDAGTLLGATAIVVIIIVLLRDPEGTSRVIRGLAEGYSTVVSPFINR